MIRVAAVALATFALAAGSAEAATLTEAASS
jgi:hypothetical protein